MKCLAKLFGTLIALGCFAIGAVGQQPLADNVVMVRVVGDTAAASGEIEDSVAAASGEIEDSVAAASGEIEDSVVAASEEVEDSVAASEEMEDSVAEPVVQGAFAFLTGGLGFVADTSMVVASLVVAAGTSAEYEVVTPGNVVHHARLVAYDETHRVGLLSVPGLELQPYLFARDPADPYQTIVGVLRSPDAYELADGRISQVVRDAAGIVATLRHDAVRPRHYNLGTPLLNTCGEALGIVVSETDDPLDVLSGTAMSVSWLRGRFQEYGLVVSGAETRCLSADERLAAVAATADAATRRADSAAAAARSAAQRAATADSAATAATQAQRRAEREAQSEIEEIRREATTDRARYARWAAIAGGGLALIALTVWFGVARAARRARRRHATAETAARAAQTDLATRQAHDRVAASVPSVFLDGTDGTGRAVGVRVPGRVIAEESGAVVGRDPFDCAVVIDHKEVSRRHFRLCHEGVGVSIVDLNSTNGTVLNGADLPPNAPVPLPDRSVLNLGGLKLTVRLQAFAIAAIVAAIAAVSAVRVSAAQTDYSFSADQWGQAELTLTLPFGDREFLSTFNTVPNFEPIADFTATNRYRQLASAVGRLDIMWDNPRRLTTCTATLIAEDHIMSNYHCIPGDVGRTVVKAAIRFGYLAEDDRGWRYDVNVEPVEASQELDYAILRVDGQPSRRFGHIPLRVRDPAPREELFILHHPEGQPQRLTRKNCRLTDSRAAVSAEHIRHRCDTSGGSSGSLIFSDNNDGSTFYAVGLHYAGFRGTAGPSSSNAAKPLTTIVGRSQFLREYAAVVGTSRSDAMGDIPVSCRPGADYGSLRVRSPVRLGRHRTVRGDANWNTDMNRFVGQISRVRALPGVDGQECLTVRVDIDDGRYVWRVADLQVVGDADTGTPLMPGAWVSGRLSEGESDWWTFTGQAGDRISIAMTSRDFDAYLELRDRDGELVQEDDDSGRDTDSYIENQVLPVSGQYTVVARAYEAGDGGEYEIILDASNRLAYGDEVHAELERGQVDDWMLAARRGDRISIVLESDDFDTELKVIDADGAVVAENDDSCDDSNSRVFELRVLRTEEWIVRVEAYFDSEGGRYALVVVRGGGATAEC